MYPHRFRIDFGNPSDKNAAIFVNDSVYNFRKGKLVRTTLNDEDLTFLLGGMYFYSFDSVKIKMKQQGYDISKSYETTLDGKEVYVIGATSATDKSTQIWVDKQNLLVLKMINYRNAQKEEAIFIGHKKFNKGWSETACDFYINDKLIQREKYFDCKADGIVNTAIFNVKEFVSTE